MKRAPVLLLLLLASLDSGCSPDPERVRALGRRRFEEAKRFYAEDFQRQLTSAHGPPPAAAAPSPSPPPSVTATPAAAATALAVAPSSPQPSAAATPVTTPALATVASPSAAGTPPIASIVPHGTVAPSPTGRPRLTPPPGRSRPGSDATQLAQATPVPALEPLNPPVAAEEDDDEGVDDQPPGADAEPPQLVSVNFVPAEARDGSEVRVVVATRDNLSGAVSGSGSLVSPSGRVFIPFALTAASADSPVLNGVLKVPPESEPGIWRLSSLRLTDRAQNANVLNPRENPVASAVQLVVASGRTDNAPPVLDSIELQPTQVEDGGTVRVLVRAHDDQSEVATIRGILANPSRTVQLNFYPKLNQASGLFEGAVALPRHSERGEWTTMVVTLTDAANNRATVPGEDERVKRARVTVVSNASDTVPPQLVSINLLPDRVPQNGAIEVVVNCLDDLSGVKGADGWVVSPNAGARLHFPMSPTANAGEFQGRVAIPECAAVGRWRVERLSLSDGSGNRALLTAANEPSLGAVGFDVFPSGSCPQP